MSQQWVYGFGESDAVDKFMLGERGFGLGQMVKLGVSVPPGFTVISEAWHHFSKSPTLPISMEEQIKNAVTRLERESQKRQGKKGMLLLSVYSDAACVMPGMTDSISFVGMNDDSVLELAARSGSERFAWDSYRKFIQVYGELVMGIPSQQFVLSSASSGISTTVEGLQETVRAYKRVIAAQGKGEFPSDLLVQLKGCMQAMFASWNSDRAVLYRTTNGISHALGFAVNVQMMVLGNLGEDSGIGVALSRNPISGEACMYGEYLMNAQGEDVERGIPEAIDTMALRWPTVFQKLTTMCRTLERHFKQMQDVEFTVEKGVLYLLHTRNGKCSASAGVKIAVEMVKESMLSKEEALLAVDPYQLDQLLHKQLEPAGKLPSLLCGAGIPASPGAGVGVCVFSAEDALRMKRETGNPVILIRTETSPEDIQGLVIAQGVLTQRGGMTSHAAVLARGMGRCSITGCDALSIKSDGRSMQLGTHVFCTGDWITLDGNTGEIFKGKLHVVDPVPSPEYISLMQWADECRTLKVRVNADTPLDAQKALEFGAQGIGLVRTEHMFFAKDRLNLMRMMILAQNKTERSQGLSRLLPFQQEDFARIFRVMDKKPVTIRLLDPPLHEFLPHEEEEMQAVVKLIPHSTLASVKRQIESLKEANPMMGFRGCRLGVVFPEITEMQLRAIFLAAQQVQQEGVVVLPEIEVPLVGHVEEFLFFKNMAKRMHEEICKTNPVRYLIGSMIEVPRAALTADVLAKECDFFSFGTNDLTQMTCGFSRDDAGKFLGDYVRQGIYPRDPFVSVDKEGVGKLMQICVSLARSVKPKMDIGICGEHGGEPASVEFCHRIGLSQVSCSPFRVPVARLAAAQARIKFGPSPVCLDVRDIFKTSQL